MKVLTVLLVLVLAGCEAKTTEKRDFILPSGMEDCKIYRMSNGNYGITVVRCPNSSTSTNYSCGKTTCNASVIDL